VRVVVGVTVFLCMDRNTLPHSSDEKEILMNKAWKHFKAEISDVRGRHGDGAGILSSFK